jgi:hypothetical protein
MEVQSVIEQENRESNRLWHLEYDEKERIRKAEEERIKLEKEKVANLIKESESWHKAELLRRFIKEAERGELRSP